MQSEKQTILIDADDTLWANNFYYESAIKLFANYVAEKTGFCRKEIIKKRHEIGINLIPKYGYGSRGFMVALIETYFYFVRANHEEILYGLFDEELQEIIKIGKSVVDYYVQVFPDALEFLHKVSGTHALFLVTKGSHKDQNDKVDRSGLRELFDGVFVVREKNEETLREILDAKGINIEDKAEREKVWMIGDSVRSDINPAKRLGIKTIWVKGDTWEYENVPIVKEGPPTLVIDNFQKIRYFFDGEEAKKQKENILK